MDASWDYLPPTFHLFDGGLLPRWGTIRMPQHQETRPYYHTPENYHDIGKCHHFSIGNTFRLFKCWIFQPVILVNSGVVFGHIKGSWVVNNPLDSHDVSPSDSHDLCKTPSFHTSSALLACFNLFHSLTGKQPNPNQKMVIKAGSLKYIYILYMYIYMCDPYHH